MLKYKFLNYIHDKEISVKFHTMLDFLQEFDYIEEKYAVMVDSANLVSLGLDQFKTDCKLPLEAKAKIALYESTQEFGELNKQEYSYISENLSLVYGDINMVKNDITTYHLVEKRFIHSYLSIPQLDKMFDEDYFDFEWDMHVGQNFSEHRNDYNRDHFTHQIRNMYMMLVLLKEFDFYEATYKILKDEASGKISEYTAKKLKQYLYKQDNSEFGLFRNILTREGVEPTSDSVNAYATDYFMKYVIYASAILSALFHDMGYPICHFLEQRHRVSEYNPTMYMFTHNAFDSFDEIEALLQDSLLFKIVSTRELKRAMQINEKKGKYNHGVYSAIAFLLQFYNNGTIHSLSLEKQCAIELAAVAIYNHTVKYKVSDETKNTNYFQPVFRQNPVSFLLRLCDDLQEWDRRYFEISRSPDLSVCSGCFGVLIPDSPYNDSRFKRTGYNCFCDGEKTFRNESFSKRRLYVVNTAKSLDVNYDNSVLSFTIDYDLYSLLKMSRVNNTSAKFRLNELNEIKRMISHQDFQYQSRGKLKFKYMYLDYFMTANPILIKVKILEEFIFSVLFDDVKESDKLIALEKVSLQQVFENGFCSVFENKSKMNAFMKRKTGLYAFLKDGVFDFYKKILYRSIQTRGQGKSFSEINNEVNLWIDSVLPKELMESYVDIVKLLIRDCVYQYNKERGAREIQDFITRKEYYEQYSPEKSIEKRLYNCVAVFCDHNKHFNKCNAFVETDDRGKRYYIGYYQDLFFFDQLNKEIRNKKYR